MVAALEQAWAVIRSEHPDVPPAVVILGAGSIGVTAGALKLGHFAAMRWRTDAEGGELLAEVFVGGEGLARGPVEVLGTLLHEAAHAVAHVRGIKDTSRQGRWHNARFKALAEELGIEVAKDDRIGWAPPPTPTATRHTYTQTITTLGAALKLYRSVERSGAATKKPGRPPATCGCGRKIRASNKVLDQGPILCGLCGEEFQPTEPDEQDPGAEESTASTSTVDILGGGPR